MWSNGDLGNSWRLRGSSGASVRSSCDLGTSWKFRGSSGASVWSNGDLGGYCKLRGSSGASVLRSWAAWAASAAWAAWAAWVARAAWLAWAAWAAWAAWDAWAAWVPRLSGSNYCYCDVACYYNIMFIRHSVNNIENDIIVNLIIKSMLGDGGAGLGEARTCSTTAGLALTTRGHARRRRNGHWRRDNMSFWVVITILLLLHVLLITLNILL